MTNVQMSSYFYFFVFRKISTSTFHDLKHGIAHLNIDLSKSRMLTCGADNMVKVRALPLLFLLLSSAHRKNNTNEFFIFLFSDMGYSRTSGRGKIKYFIFIFIIFCGIFSRLFFYIS